VGGQESCLISTNWWLEGARPGLTLLPPCSCLSTLCSSEANAKGANWFLVYLHSPNCKGSWFSLGLTSSSRLRPFVTYIRNILHFPTHSTPHEFCTSYCVVQIDLAWSSTLLFVRRSVLLSVRLLASLRGNFVLFFNHYSWMKGHDTTASFQIPTYSRFMIILSFHCTLCRLIYAAERALWCILKINELQWLQTMTCQGRKGQARTFINAPAVIATRRKTYRNCSTDECKVENRFRSTSEGV
jgi:hypothetical protein